MTGSMRLGLAKLGTLALTACGSSGTPSPATATAHPAAPAAASHAPAVPVLRDHAAVSFADLQPAGQDSATRELETWKLASVHYISRAAADKGGTDGDVSAGLGSYSLRPGQRWLVLGLTIADHGPAGMSNTTYTVSDASYGWQQASGATGLTADYCLGQSPPGSPQIFPRFVSDMCVTNGMQPGQHVTGHLFFAVPDAPAVVSVTGQDGTAPELFINPDGLPKIPG